MRRDRPRDPLAITFRHENHKRPVTRRDFIAQGFLTGAAAVFAPSLFGLLGRRGVAHAQSMPSCSLGGGGTTMPFITIDLTGGANIAAGNVLVGGPGGQLDPLSADGYMTAGGLPSGFTPSTVPAGTTFEDASLGLLFHFDSAMLRGIKRFASPEAMANVNGVVFCARSQNDTANNPHNPIYGINKAGANGNLLPLIGNEPTDSGGNSIVPAAMFDPAVRPTKVDRPSDARGLVDTGRLVSMLGTTGAGEVMSTVSAISDEKLVKIAEQAPVTNVVHCAYQQASQLVVAYGDPGSLDPLNDPDIAPQAVPGPTDPVPIFASASDVANIGDYRRMASVMKLVVEQHAGAGVVQLGGYDYHDSNRSNGELKDERAGETIGAAIEFAHRRGQDLAIYVFSDGAISSNGQLDNSTNGRGKGIWKSDNQNTAATFMLVYSARGPYTVTTNQIGYFRTSGNVETSPGGAAAQISNAPDLLAQAVVLNYLALHGREGEFASVLNMVPNLLTGSLSELIAFPNLRS